MALNYEFVSDIEATIRSVESDYKRNQGLILTESDLAALVYARLRSLKKLDEIAPNEDKT